MARLAQAVSEARLTAKYASVSLVGFGVDALLLHLGLWAGLEPAWARVGSLLAAMQVTFVLNGLHVFKGLERERLVRQWTRYMVSNGFGNFCNYWIFVTLVSLHWRVVSGPMVALTVGSLVAWLINYGCTRYWVFAKVRNISRRAGGPDSGP